MFNTKKKYFKKKLDAVERMIWDLEFKRFKIAEIREDIRQEYDQLKSKLGVLEVKLKAEETTPTISKDEKARLDDSKVLLERDLGRYQEQMKNLDLEVVGSKKTNEFPDGVEGINQQLDALRELEIMIKNYIKEL